MKYINRYLRLTIQNRLTANPMIFDDSWKIVFNIHKLASSNYLSFNTAEISVYNLTSEYRTTLSQTNYSITLDAGYQEKHGVVFEGVINNVAHVRQGTDIITTFYCASNTSQYDKDASASVQNMTVTDLISMLCEKVSVNYELPFTRSEVVSRSFIGTFAQVIASICSDYRISAAIDNGTLIFKDKEKDPSTINKASIYTYTPDTGLLGNPMINERGVSFRSFINSDAQVNSYFKLYAPYAAYNLGNLTRRPNTVVGGSLNAMAFIDTQSYEGLYMMLSLSVSGDTRGNTWYTDVEGSRIWNREAYA